MTIDSEEMDRNNFLLFCALRDIDIHDAQTAHAAFQSYKMEVEKRRSNEPARSQSATQKVEPQPWSATSPQDRRGMAVGWISEAIRVLNQIGRPYMDKEIYELGGILERLQDKSRQMEDDQFDSASREHWPKGPSGSIPMTRQREKKASRTP